MPVRRPWTPAELKRLKALYPTQATAEVVRALGRSHTSVYQQARKMGLGKSKAFLDQSPARRAFIAGGAQHRFSKGFTPWNKGTNYRAGGRAAETWFQPGNTPPQWRPVGSERTDVDGYRWRKVSDTGIKAQDWKMVHVILWERYRGKVRKGKFLVFKDRNKKNIRLSNLEVVNRAEHMARNSLHRLPKPLKDVIITLKVLKRRIKNNGKY